MNLPDVRPFADEGRIRYGAVRHGKMGWTAANHSSVLRVAIITRYCPWWLSVEFGGRNNAIVPRSTYEALPEEVKALYRHRAKGEENPFLG